MLRALFDSAVGDLLSAASEEEALMRASIVATMLEAVAASCADPLAMLATVFGREATEVCATACAYAARDLDAEAAAAGGHVSEPAAARVARNIVRRIQRVGRTRLFAPRALRVRGVHVRRAPRARRAHRRAVRLSAVASAGDGPPPPSSDREPPPPCERPRRSLASLLRTTVAPTNLAACDVGGDRPRRAVGAGDVCTRERRRDPTCPYGRVGASARRHAPSSELARGSLRACPWPSRARLGGAGGW